MADRTLGLRPLGSILGLALFALSACGGSGEHDRTAADETTNSEAESPGDEAPATPAPKSDDTAPVDKELPAAGDAKRLNPMQQSNQGDDVHAVLQLTIDDTELDQYLKLGEPGRFPLKVAGKAVPQGIELVKATKPVVITSPPTDKKDPVLVITDVDIEGKNATVSYRYDVEGIRGTAYLKKTPHGWELSNSRIVEHGGLGKGLMNE